MLTDTRAETAALRATLRDLVALSAMPAAWVGREPTEISTGLADVLVGSLRLDFAFVRLCGPNGAAAVEATRGDTWKAFPEWLRSHLARVGQLSRHEIVHDVAGPGSCRGVVIPIGVDGEGGLVAAACGRSDFPSEIDQLLLSVAANHGATAFQSARLVSERRRAEEALRQSEHELRKARDELEMKVAERTAELQRSKDYLAEAQRLSHTGSFGWDVLSGEIYWTEETFRIFDYQDCPKATVDLVLARTHPDDRAFVQEAIDRAGRERKHFDLEHRLLMPDGLVKYVHLVGHAIERNESGNVEYVGAVMDITARKRAEDALRRSEAYLAEAQRLTHTGSWSVKAATKEILHSSEEHRRLYGFDRREGVPTFAAFRERIHPDDRAARDEMIERAIREGTPSDAVFRAVLPDGTLRYIHSVGRPVFTAGGEVLEIVGTSMDVTEHRRADEEREQLLLRERAALAETVAAQQRFKDLVNSVEGIVWEADAATFQFSFVSKQAERVLGYPVERWLSEPTFWKDHLHPNDREWAVTFCVSATGEGRDHEFEYRMIAADGSVVWLRDLVTVVAEGGRATRLRGVMFDITKRKRAEYLIRQVFESSPDGVSIVGRDYRYRRVNPIYERWAGIQGEKIVGRHVADLIGADVFEQKVKPNLDRCFAGEEVSFGEWFSGAPGRRYFSTSYSPLRPDSDRVEAALVISRDFTEHMIASEALRQAQSDLAHINRATTMGELTASLAHEVNQPIAAAVTNANTCLRWLGRDNPDVDEARAAASRIVKDATRAAEIISRIRALFTKGPAERELIEVNGLIREMILVLRSEATRYSTSLRTELAADLPRVIADRVQLQQVMMNLMINGIDAMKEARGRRELTIKSERGGNEHLLISVSDTGVGLPQQADQIFNAFFTTKPHGTGMGLSISRSIIESHGGRLWAAVNCGPGATFFFTLPTQLQT